MKTTNTRLYPENPIDPLFGKPHDNISGITGSGRPPVSEILKSTDGRVSMSKERAANLQKLTSVDKVSAPTPKISRKGVVFAGALTLAALAGPLGGAEVVSDVVRGTGDRIDQNFDSHNLPPGGEPLEYRGGVAYEPGTNNTILVPEIKSEP